MDDREMCQSPYKLPDRPDVQVPCLKCDWCRTNRVNDFVGRALAEQRLSSRTLALTLTYAGGEASAAILRYTDIQRFLKRLRKAGYSVRYICAGEFGAQKGRAHWHMILFFQGISPEVAIEARVNWEFWPHGFSYFQEANMKGFRYVLKYALKDETSVRPLALSKKPPLGHDFFMELADTMVSQRIPMRSAEYSIAGEKVFVVKDRKYHHAKFWLQGRMREMFFDRYVCEWRRIYSEEPPETDFLYEKYLDPIARREMYCDPLLLERDIAARRFVRPADDGPAGYAQQIAFLLTDTPKGCVVLYDDGSVIYTDGGKPWQVSGIESGKSVVSARLREQLQRLPLGEAMRWQVEVWLRERLQSLLAQSKPSEPLPHPQLSTGNRA